MYFLQHVHARCSRQQTSFSSSFVSYRGQDQSKKTIYGTFKHDCLHLMHEEVRTRTRRRAQTAQRLRTQEIMLALQPYNIQYRAAFIPRHFRAVTHANTHTIKQPPPRLPPPSLTPFTLKRTPTVFFTKFLQFFLNLPQRTAAPLRTRQAPKGFPWERCCFCFVFSSSSPEGRL